METFLKQYSIIPEDFIKDFFIIAKENYLDNEIIINLDIISKWLNTRKDNIKKILIDNFEQHFDFKIKKIRKKHKIDNKTSNYDEILITPNCFKELCMISQTKKAKEVRKYFIELEKLIKRYFETIKEDMLKKIGLLETNLKPKNDIMGGVIYVLRALNSDTTLYKLGMSSDLKKRLNNYNTGNANDIEPLFILPVKDIKSVESCIKNACKKFQFRKYKEVYEIDIQVLKEVISDCNEFVNNMAIKLQDKNENKLFKKTISRMKKKIDKYFIYVSKDEHNIE